MDAFLDSIEEFIWNFAEPLEEKFGVLGLLIPLVLFFVILFLLRLLVFKPYRQYLRETYCFNLMGWPTRITIAVYLALLALPTFLGTESIIFGQESDAIAVRNILLAGLPCILLVFLNCLRKTHSPLHAIVSSVMVWILAFFTAYLWVFIIGFVIIAKFFGLIFSSKAKEIRDEERRQYEREQEGH